MPWYVAAAMLQAFGLLALMDVLPLWMVPALGVAFVLTLVVGPARDLYRAHHDASRSGTSA